MPDIPFLEGETTSGLLEITLRLLLAILLGGVIGLDRELRNKAAGLRTHMLVSLAAAVFTLITFELFYEIQETAERPNADAIRIIEAVTAGVAFLAAGAIIQSRGGVKGLTTGASMWLAGAVGLACGGGYYAIALIATFLAWMVLLLLGKFEAHFLSDDDKGGDAD